MRQLRQRYRDPARNHWIVSKPRGRAAVSFGSLAAATCYGVLAVVGSGLVGQVQGEGIDFQGEIRPILVEHCLQCHGPDSAARESDLRLDLKSSAIGRRESRTPAIRPGDAAGSPLMLRVRSEDPDYMMPPPAHNKPLSQRQIELLGRWIQEGAPFESHWAFRAPQRVELPPADGVAGAHPVDRLVARRLNEPGWSLATAAPAAVLCRRIHLDLVGLPPSPQEVEVFCQAAESGLSAAVQQRVNALLASPHYGEKWARHWLDVARYADSNGYEKDLPREQWIWRNWVIDAINRDLPYDRFLIEQIAGDLLPDRTQDQLVASGFLRNGMINEEGAIVAEQFRMEGLFDRMDCIGKAVLGLSLQCAQCHSHKFDPLSQEEYYGIFGFLNDTYEAKSWVYEPAQLKRITQIDKAVANLETEIQRRLPAWQTLVENWAQQEVDRRPAWQVIEPSDQVWVGGVNHPQKLADQSVVILGHPTTTGEMYVRGTPEFNGVTGLRIEALTYGDLPFGGPGRSPRGVFALSELSLSVRLPGTDEWRPLKLSQASCDFEEPAQRLIEVAPEPKPEKPDKRLVGPVSYLIDGLEETGWRSDRGPGRRNTESVAVVQLAEPATFPAGTELNIKLVMKHSLPGDARQTTQLGRMRFAVTRSPQPVAPDYDWAAGLALDKPAAQWAATERAVLFTAWRKTVAQLADINQAIETWQRTFPEAPTSVLHLAVRRQEESRDTFLLDRGAWDRPLRKVVPHVPAVLHTLAATDGVDRLAFARWLADRRSPLTARVQVNRVWQAMFGRGLVATPEDFGTRAEKPVHLELLDWLAVDLMENDWSVKHLIGTIVTSRTYQQDSRVTVAARQADPENRWLARGPRFRAEAEVVRDIALSVAGLLHPRIGGPSIYPPVPQSVLNDNFTRPDYWLPPPPPERYRRALYLFRKRSMPDPVLSTFDAPNADFACARRVRSNTPLASLVSMNEPVFVAASRGLALRILAEGGTTDASRVDYAYRLCTGRAVRSQEQEVVLSLLESRRRELAQKPASAREMLLDDQDRLPAQVSETGIVEGAAWMVVARVLLNLDETLTKN